MQSTSELYRKLLASNHSKQTRLVIGESVEGNNIFNEDKLYSIKTSVHLFSEDNVSIGSCVSGEIDIVMVAPDIEFSRQAKLRPYVRLTNGVEFSEWIQKGEYFIDTRQIQDKGTGIRKLIIHGYDAMLKAEQDYSTSSLAWPAVDIRVVEEIAAKLGVSVDERTYTYLDKGYAVQLPSMYTYRETLGYIAAMYAGCFVMSDLGALRFVPFWDLPDQYSYLVTEDDSVVEVGGVHIRVW